MPLRIEQLSKRYGNNWALRDIDLDAGVGRNRQGGFRGAAVRVVVHGHVGHRASVSDPAGGAKYLDRSELARNAQL